MKKAMPSSIKHPDAFLRSAPPGFDGIFDWSWTHGCLGQKKITPMDFDGVVERKGNFLVFETKGNGVPIKKGQLITLEAAYELGCFTILLIEGKEKPEKAMAWCQPGFKNGKRMRQHKDVEIEALRGFVSDWYAYADKHRRKGIDVCFLNRRIIALEASVEEARDHAASLVKALGGEVSWYTP